MPCIYTYASRGLRTNAAATTTPENNDLIGWMRKNNRAARAGRSLAQVFDEVCQMTTWIFRGLQNGPWSHLIEVNTELLPCNEDVFPDSSGLSSSHCSCVFIAKALHNLSSELESTQEPRSLFSASAFIPANSANFLANTTKDEY